MHGITTLLTLERRNAEARRLLAQGLTGPQIEHEKQLVKDIEEAHQRLASQRAAA